MCFPHAPIIEGDLQVNLPSALQVDGIGGSF